MITKPEEAIPKLMAYDRKDPHGVNVVQGFTAAECSQIAHAYAKTKLEAKKYRKVDISANQEPYPDEAWEAKFKEWEM